MTSTYSPVETHMIICITRSRDCTPEMCLKCGWLRNEVRQELQKEQAEWEASKFSTTPELCIKAERDKEIADYIERRFKPTVNRILEQFPKESTSTVALYVIADIAQEVRNGEALKSKMGVN